MWSSLLYYTELKNTNTLLITFPYKSAQSYKGYLMKLIELNLTPKQQFISVHGLSMCFILLDAERNRLR